MPRPAPPAGVPAGTSRSHSVPLPSSSTQSPSSNRSNEVQIQQATVTAFSSSKPITSPFCIHANIDHYSNSHHYTNLTFVCDVCLSMRAGGHILTFVYFNSTSYGILCTYLGSPPRPSLCPIHMRGHTTKLQDQVPTQIATEVSCGQHGLSTHTSSHSTFRRSSHWVGCWVCLKKPTPTTYQSIWGNPKGTQHRQVAADHRPLLPSCSKRELRHRSRPMLFGLHHSR